MTFHNLTMTPGDDILMRPRTGVKT